jgi:hypothetical protein
MAASALGTIIAIVMLIIETTMNTLIRISGLFGNLLEALGIVSAYGGSAGFLISIIIVTIVVYFLAKFFFKSGKLLIILLPIAILLYILLLSLIA